MPRSSGDDGFLINSSVDFGYNTAHGAGGATPSAPAAVHAHPLVPRSSGDDVFMLENALIKFPEKVGYLKSTLAIVTTFPEKNWQDLISQRVRWAKKTGKQKNAFVKIIGLLVFAANISILLLPFFLILFRLNVWIGIIALFIKIFIDYQLLHKTGQFFGKHISVVQVVKHVYVYASISCWVVIKSMFTNYTWKHRTHSQ